MLDLPVHLKTGSASSNAVSARARVYVRALRVFAHWSVQGIATLSDVEAKLKANHHQARPSKADLQRQLEASQTPPRQLTATLHPDPTQPRLQGSIQRPWATPVSVDESVDTWLMEGHSVSIRRPSPPAEWATAYETCPDFQGFRMAGKHVELLDSCWV